VRAAAQASLHRRPGRLRDRVSSSGPVSPSSAGSACLIKWVQRQPPPRHPPLPSRPPADHPAASACRANRPYRPSACADEARRRVVQIDQIGSLPAPSTTLPSARQLGGSGASAPRSPVTFRDGVCCSQAATHGCQRADSDSADTISGVPDWASWRVPATGHFAQAGQVGSLFVLIARW